MVNNSFELEKKYFEDINWYLMKEVDPITYFAKIELKCIKGKN